MLNKGHALEWHGPYFYATISEPIDTRRRSQLCRTDQSTSEPVCLVVITYFGSEQPRITVSVLLP
jgi:hypothetical protein